MTVSTSKYANRMRNEEVNDESGGIAEEIVRSAKHVVSKQFLISDDVSMLKGRMKEFLSGSDDILIFVGGTGVSHDDLTIETVRPYFERELEGFGEILRKESYKRIGASAFLTRATAGVAKGRLIVCLPGSPDAVETALRMFVKHFPDIISNART